MALGQSNGYQSGFGNKLGENSIGSIAYNSTLATNNINAFEGSFSPILNKLGSAYKKMMDDLNSNWASPAAQKFFTDSARFLEILEEGREKGNSIINDAIGAVKQMAKANSSNYSYSTQISYNPPVLTPLRNNIDGYQGIDMDKTKDIVATFSSEVNTTLGELASVANSIAIYDSEHHIISLYGDRIGELKKNVEDMVAQINANIDKTVKKQEDVLNAARRRIVARFENVNHRARA